MIALYNHIDENINLMTYLDQLQRDGNMKGLIVSIVKNDGTMEAYWSSNLTFLERVGVAEVTKHDIIRKANE